MIPSTFPSKGVPVDEQIKRAKIELKVGETVDIVAEPNESYTLSYLLERIDATPIYSFTNKATRDTVRFDRYSIPSIFKHLELGTGQNIKDFDYVQQSYLLRSINNPAALQNIKEKLQPLARNYLERIPLNVASVFVEKEALTKSAVTGERYYTKPYIEAVSSGDTSSSPNPKEYYLPHGTPELVWNDPYNVISHHTGSQVEFTVQEISTYRELSFGWILRLVGSKDIIGFAPWGEHDAIERLVEVMEDKEATAIQAFLMNPGYFEDSENYGFVEKKEEMGINAFQPSDLDSEGRFKHWYTKDTLYSRWKAKFVRAVIWVGEH